MADDVKEVMKTPPPPQLSTDDNRRRTRSQTRNGGVSTPPAPVTEPRGRKRASQSQPGSDNKRGRKPTRATPIKTVDDSATKETKVHSKQAENQDLSIQKPTETVGSEPAERKKEKEEGKNEDVSAKPTEGGDLKTEGEERASDEVTIKAQKDAASEDVCRAVEEKPATKANDEPAKKDDLGEETTEKALDGVAEKETKEVVESTDDKETVENSCALQKDPTSDVSKEAEKESSQENKEDNVCGAVEEEKTQVV